MAAKRVAIMVDQMYQVLEVWYPYYRFKGAGLGVNLVAADSKKERNRSSLSRSANSVRLRSEISLAT